MINSFMNLLYDLTAVQPNPSGKVHGGGKYGLKLFIELAKNNNGRANVYAVYNSTEYLDQTIINSANNYNITLIDIIGTNWGNITEKYSIDRLYSALPENVVGMANLKCQIYGTIHGLRELETRPDWHEFSYNRNIKAIAKVFIKLVFKDFFFKRKYKRYESLFKRLRFFTVTNHSKYSLMVNFPDINEKDVQVYYAVDVTDLEETGDRNSDFNESDYFLMVSGNRWIKNNLRSAIALDQLFTERPHIKNKVVITGVSDKKIYLDRIKNKERFIFYNYVDEGLLANMYKNAFAFLYMTLNEGFGYPPLEAMQFKTPVISSPYTSLTEVCNNAVLYADPYSVMEIKNRILQLFDSDVYSQLVANGVKNYAYIKQIQDKHLYQLINQLLT